ncbi:uncharacterized protein LOC124148299 [Haliotis rufescens]|uniref:uncharacterized protein LOC124148299 n=1 Tax=Haliotis rufescens TaxID=6454 RepID=UPI001EB08205|nr:uncharacterized protein LOC124148299 [Haliotis rufescens]
MSHRGGARGGPPGPNPVEFTFVSRDQDCSGIQIGTGNKVNVMNVPGGMQTRSQARAAAGAPKVKVKTPKRPLSKSENEPTRDQMDRVCKKLTKYNDTAWKDLGTKLGLTTGELETIHHDHRIEGDYELSYQTLLVWKRRQPTPPQVKVLAKALCDIGRGDLSDTLT